MAVWEDFGYLVGLGKTNLRDRETEEMFRRNQKAAQKHTQTVHVACSGFWVKPNHYDKMKCLTGSQACTAGMSTVLNLWSLLFFKGHRREKEWIERESEKER